VGDIEFGSSRRSDSATSDSGPEGTACDLEFRSLRRSDRAISPKAAHDILISGIFGCLGVKGDKGYPYVVPLNYVYDAEHNRIYFHSALEGYKLDAIKCDDRVCFCVVTNAQVLPNEISMRFDSVICFGRASIVEGREKEYALRMLVQKYILGKATITSEDVSEYVERHIRRTAIVRIDVEHLTGKSRPE
jgi:nitroimidazol reductase NimA-like FMN-containing flavoprotein (pyridoxamine 5'-phosphate oxidase superfamily)